MIPHVDLDVAIARHVRCGDALLGVTSLDQVRWMHMDPDKGRQIHGLLQPVSDDLIRESAGGRSAA
jgi:hypothetical protein